MWANFYLISRVILDKGLSNLLPSVKIGLKYKAEPIW